MQTIATGGASFYVALPDLNHDGNLDIVTLNSYAGGVLVLLGNGDGTFQTEQSYSAGAFSYGLVVADFNKDGNVDVVAANYTRLDSLRASGQR